MIFYFSGTGNSLYAAREIAGKEEPIINITEAVEAKQFSYSIAPGEKVGFVFPVYFYTLNDVVGNFVEKLTLEHADYVYAVVTCGGSIGGTGSVLEKKLQKRGIRLANVYSLLMPDNAMLYYNIATKEESMARLKQSNERIRKIKASIERKEAGKIKGNLIAPLMGGIYHCAKATKKFYVTDACVSCGLCEKNCQDHAIAMQNGRPTWVKKECTKCTACINGCPKQAIQYGKATEKRNRYMNPYV